MQLDAPTREQPAPAREHERRANPARARGLRRAARYRAPCAPAGWTALPAPVDAVSVLALLTRVRAERVAAGEISARRLYDVRAFKSAYAELGYLRTLTRRPTGGTIVTSMPQLVAGLARLHPAWTMDGEKFADRDRHHSAVRRRLGDLQAMGLLYGASAQTSTAKTRAPNSNYVPRPRSPTTSSSTPPRSSRAGRRATAPRSTPAQLPQSLTPPATAAPWPPASANAAASRAHGRALKPAVWLLKRFRHPPSGL